MSLKNGALTPSSLIKLIILQQRTAGLSELIELFRTVISRTIERIVAYPNAQLELNHMQVVSLSLVFN